MCFVYIVINGSVSKVPADALEAKVRLAHIFKKSESKDVHKQVAKQQPRLTAGWRQSTLHAQQQSSCVLDKALEPYWGPGDTMGHYKQSCKEHNHRQQACFKTARRREVVRY